MAAPLNLGENARKRRATMNRFFRFLRWGPYDDAAGWLRGLAISVAAAFFLSMVGAFDSGRVPFIPRLG
jgi:hypothetical protein